MGGTGRSGTKPGAGLEDGRCDGEDRRNGLHVVGRRANDGTKDEQAELSAGCLVAGVKVERNGAIYAECVMLQQRRGRQRWGVGCSAEKGARWDRGAGRKEGGVDGGQLINE